MFVIISSKFIVTSSLVMSVTISWSIALFRISPAFIFVVSVFNVSVISHDTYRFVFSLYSAIFVLNADSLALPNRPVWVIADIVIPANIRRITIVITSAISVIPVVFCFISFSPLYFKVLYHRLRPHEQYVANDCHHKYQSYY